jgi:Ni,Fe-hydrogenase I small subunit
VVAAAAAGRRFVHAFGDDGRRRSLCFVLLGCGGDCWFNDSRGGTWRHLDNPDAPGHGGSGLNLILLK